MMPHYVVFDVETRKLAQDLGCEFKPCYHSRNECGWDALKGGEGGLSAIVVWDSLEEKPYLYDDKTLEACAKHLESADYVIGFNSAEFDVKPIEGILDRRLVLKEHIDLLQLIWRELRRRNQRVKGNTLDEVGRRTIGVGKSGDGMHAPALANEGRFAELFQYCMDDVTLTHNIFKHVARHGGVIALDGSFLPLELPSELRMD
jgi:DEAD/DEAH box helicase domain-containing protein